MRSTVLMRTTLGKSTSANAARNLRDILRISDDCGTLREAIEDENTARAARRFAFIDQTPTQHRDVGMALLSAVAVAICLSSSTLSGSRAVGLTE